MKKLVIAVATCSALALTGCGDSEPKKEAAPALTKAEWIKQADAVCAASEKRIDKLGAEITANTSMDEIHTFLADKVVPELKATTEALRKLEPPKADAARIDTMLDSVEADVAKVEKDPMTLMDDSTFAASNKLAKDYGLKVCSE